MQRLKLSVEASRVRKQSLANRAERIALAPRFVFAA
jgi:hypothetical protein